MSGYYVKDRITGELQGPLDSGQVRALADSGKLKRSDLLSKDQKQWVRAAKVKGLSFPAESPGTGDLDEKAVMPPGTEPGGIAEHGAVGSRGAEVAGRPGDGVGGERYDLATIIAMGVGGLGLLIVALSPLFKWINFGGGGITGISGDGKIVLVVSVALIIGCALAVFTKKRLGAVSLGAGAWGTVVLLWMGGLICQVGAIFNSSEVDENPFAAILATQVSPGAGLYLGLIGGLLVAVTMGFWAVCHFRSINRLRYFYITQTAALIVGFLVAVAGAPEGPNESSGDTPFSSSEDEVTTVEVGEEIQLGQMLFKPLGAWAGPITLKSSGFYGEQTRHYSEPVFMLAVQVTNISRGQVFAPVPKTSDAWEICTVVDSYGNRDLASAVCQCGEWPAPDEAGEEPWPLKPKESAVLVLVVDELANPSADSFTWNLECRTDNQYSTRLVAVITPAEDVQVYR